MKHKTVPVITTPAQNDALSEQRLRIWHWLIFALILILGLVLRAGYLVDLRNEPDFAAPVGDMAFHDFWARTLVTGDCPPPKGTENPHLETIPFLRPPGYPYFLALIYKLLGLSYLTPRIVQAFLGLINCCLAFFLGRQWFDPATGLIWSAMMAGYWVFIYFEGDLNAPVLMIFLFLILMALLWRWKNAAHPAWLCAAAVVLGISALVAPNMMLLIPVVGAWAGWVVWRHGKLKHSGVWAVVFCILAAATIAPATIRNYRVSGDPILISCNGPITLYAGNNERSNGIIARIPNMEKLTGGVDGWGWFVYPDMVREIQKEQNKTMSYSQVSRYFSNQAWNYIRNHPGQTAFRMFKKTLMFWGPEEITSSKAVQLEKSRSPFLRYGPGFPVFWAPALVGLALLVWRYVKNRRNSLAAKGSWIDTRWEMAVLIVGFVMIYFMSFLPFVVSSRFRTPIVPFVLLACTYSIRCWGSYLNQRRWFKAIAWVIVTGCVFALVSRPVAEPSMSPAMWHLKRGEVCYNERKWDDALNEFQQALALNPDFALAHEDIAFLFFRTGNQAQAVAHANEAFRLGSHSADLHCEVGLALLSHGQAEQGAQHLLECLRLNPNKVAACKNLGIYYAHTHDWPRAYQMFVHANQLLPNDFDILKLLAKTCLSGDRLEEAITHLNACASLRPDDPETHFLLALAYQEQKKSDLARKEILRTLELKPDFPNARKLLNQMQNP